VKIKRTALFLILVFAIISACAPKQPAKKPAMPKIPKKINRGTGKEPILKVYEVQTKTIKEMKLEDYVTGVVAGEMENSWPIEALAAQAILARTYVLEFITDKGGSNYENADISTDFEEAQAWNPDNINDRIRKAVRMTRGEVIVHRGKYIKSWFHSHAGGMTALAREGLGFKDDEPPYIQIKKSPDADAGPAGKKTWSTSFSKDELRFLIKKEIGADPGEINSVSVAERGPSGRVTRIKIGDATLSAPDLRIAVGSMRMKSTLLTSLRIEGDKIIMAGKGFGHGVGLSQWGANVLAGRGKSPKEIIKYYFKNVDIVELWK
jgi:stage II sporulation protein D